VGNFGVFTRTVKGCFSLFAMQICFVRAYPYFFIQRLTSQMGVLVSTDNRSISSSIAAISGSPLRSIVRNTPFTKEEIPLCPRFLAIETASLIIAYIGILSKYTY